MVYRRRMADLSRALAIPGLVAPSDSALKNLVLYWDEVVVLEYRDRAGGDGSPSVRSDVAKLLESAGAIRYVSRSIDLSGVYVYDDRGRAYLPAPTRSLGERARPDTTFTESELVELGREWLTDLATQHYLARTADAFDLALENHLAPVAVSMLAHVASLLGAEQDDDTVGVASLISAAVTAFMIEPGTRVEDILIFREQNRASLGRFRAALADLRGQLAKTGPPQARLASARDTYRNRVVPALAALEESINESRLRFLLKSLIGASSIALSPMAPAKALEGTAAFAGQSLTYAFSRRRMVEQHPFGFLHKLSGEMGASPSTASRELYEPVRGEGQSIIAKLLREEAPSREAEVDFISEFILDDDTLRAEAARRGLILVKGAQPQE